MPNAIKTKLRVGDLVKKKNHFGGEVVVSDESLGVVLEIEHIPWRDEFWYRVFWFQLFDEFSLKLVCNIEGRDHRREQLYRVGKNARPAEDSST